MSNMKIEIIGAPVLRDVAEDVTEFGEPLEKFAGQMVQTMIDNDGIGLAAPQVGLSKRFLVIGLPVDEDDSARKILAVANPEIIEEGEELVTMEEGCLSIPGISEEVTRPEAIKVRFQDLQGKTVETEFSGLLSRVFQHEYDHLDGVLFVDHLSALKRRLLKKKLSRLSEEA